VVAVKSLDRSKTLIGVVAAAAGFAAFAAAQAGPGASSGGQPVIDFYVAHRGAALTSDYLWTATFACFLLFAATLRRHLRTSAGDTGFASLSLVAAGVATVGGTLYFGFDAALAASPRTLTPAAAQALNVLALKMFLPLAVGGLLYGATTAVGILKAGALPRWLGWSALAVGVSFVTPIGIFAVPLLLLWSGVAGVCAYRRPPTSASDPAPAPSELLIPAR
jgi:hypothetical protein